MSFNTTFSHTYTRAGKYTITATANNQKSVDITMQQGSGGGGGGGGGGVPAGTPARITYHLVERQTLAKLPGYSVQFKVGNRPYQTTTTDSDGLIIIDNVFVGDTYRFNVVDSRIPRYSIPGLPTQDMFQHYTGTILVTNEIVWETVGL